MIRTILAFLIALWSFPALARGVLALFVDNLFATVAAAMAPCAKQRASP